MGGQKKWLLEPLSIPLHTHLLCTRRKSPNSSRYPLLLIMQSLLIA